jgi:hypothetical protein
MSILGYTTGLEIINKFWIGTPTGLGKIFLKAVYL